MLSINPITLGDTSIGLYASLALSTAVYLIAQDQPLLLGVG
jgi:hypothetical protein